MSAIEVTRFRLADTIEPERFVEADAAMQEWCYLNLAGIQRRTVARSGDGTWIVIQLFDSLEHCEAANVSDNRNDVPRQWSSMIDPSSVVRERYSLL